MILKHLLIKTISKISIQYCIESKEKLVLYKNREVLWLFVSNFSNPVLVLKKLTLDKNFIIMNRIIKIMVKVQHINIKEIIVLDLDLSK